MSRSQLSPDGKVLAVAYQPTGRGLLGKFAVNLWDVAPLDILVRAAGGSFTNVEGRPGPHGRGAVATNGLLHEAVLAMLNAM